MGLEACEAEGVVLEVEPHRGRQVGLFKPKVHGVGEAVGGCKEEFSDGVFRQHLRGVFALTVEEAGGRAEGRLDPLQELIGNDERGERKGAGVFGVRVEVAEGGVKLGEVLIALPPYAKKSIEFLVDLSPFLSSLAGD